jgi:hypothetical protein
MLRWELRHRPTPRRRLRAGSLPIAPRRPTRPEAPRLDGSPLEETGDFSMFSSEDESGAADQSASVPVAAGR